MSSHIRGTPPPLPSNTVTSFSSFNGQKLEMIETHGEDLYCLAVKARLTKFDFEPRNYLFSDRFIISFPVTCIVEYLLPKGILIISSFFEYA